MKEKCKIRDKELKGIRSISFTSKDQPKIIRGLGSFYYFTCNIKKK